MPNLSLSICEYYNSCIHGRDEDSSREIDGHILCAYEVPRETIFHSRKYPFRFLGRARDKLYWWDVTQTAFWKNAVTNDADYAESPEARNFLQHGHAIIRNYFPIIRARGIRSLEIAKTLYLAPGGECVCILKTFWFRIFQRKVRNWIRDKALVSNCLRTSRHLILREIGGFRPPIPPSSPSPGSECVRGRLMRVNMSLSSLKH